MKWERQHTEKHQDKGPQISQTENPPSLEFPLVHPIVVIHCLHKAAESNHRLIVTFYMPTNIFDKGSLWQKY